MSASTTVVLITGANSGIGLATAKVLAAASQDYHVIVAGRSQQKINVAASEITARDGTISTLLLDIVDENSVNAAVEEVKRRFGRLDVLVNNAGVANQDPSLKTQVEESFRTNVTGTVLVTEAFKPLLLESKHACVVHVSSGLGSIQMALDKNEPIYHSPWTPYRISKAALNMYAAQNYKEFSQLGIRVFAICPGLVRSNLRGTSEEEISAGGRAGEASVSGELILDVIEGRRDKDLGSFVRKDGTYRW